MTNNIHSSPGIYGQEIDISQITQTQISSAVALVGASSKGPVGPVYYTNDKAFLTANGAPNPQTGFAHYSALAALRAGGAVWFNRVVGATSAYSITAYRAAAVGPPAVAEGLYAVSPGLVTPSAYAWAAGDVFIAYPVGPGTAYKNLVLAVTNVVAAGQSFTLSVFDSSNLNVPLESFKVSIGNALDGYGRQTQIAQVVNNQSQLIRVIVNPTAPGAMAVTPTGAQQNVAFANAVDDDAVTDAELIAGWNVFKDTNSYKVGLLGDCGYALPDVQTAMDAVARSRNDCLAVLSTPANAQASAALMNTYRTTTLNLNSSYSALFGPDYLYYDDLNDMYLYVPISGGVIAAMVANDLKQGPWTPAAGETGVLPNCFGLRTAFTVGDNSDYSLMYPNQINIVIVQPGAGFQIYGNVTLQSIESSLSMIHARRLLAIIEPSAIAASRFALFKLNTEFRRTQLATALNGLLAPFIANGALANGTAVCNGTNNTPATIQAKQMNADMYVQITPDAEVININTVVTPLTSSVSELATSGVGIFT